MHNHIVCIGSKLENMNEGKGLAMERRIFEQHIKYKDKTMDELITERAEKLSVGQNNLRKKWLPEKYSSNKSDKNPFENSGH